MRVDPTLNAFESVFAESRCLCWIVSGEAPELPFPVLMIEIGDAGIVWRPCGVADVTAKQFLYAIRIVIVFGEDAGRSFFAGKEQFLAVMGGR